MKHVTILLTSTLFILSVFLSGCSESFHRYNRVTEYKFMAPDRSSVLPDILHEISGLTDIDSTTFACIQDENGILFIYDTGKDAITEQYKFNIDGDYEGITRVDRTIYVLKSDGVLFEITDYDSKDFKLTFIR